MKGFRKRRRGNTGFQRKEGKYLGGKAGMGLERLKGVGKTKVRR